MPDLHALLAAEARRLEADLVPAFDDLLARGRRRQTRRGLAAVFGVVALGVAISLAGWTLRRQSAPPANVSAPTAVAPISTAVAPIPTVALPVPVEVYVKLRALALALAQRNGDPTPSRLEAVKVNTALPSVGRQPSPSSAPLTGGYVVQVQGAFVCLFCKGAGDLRGTVMREQVSAPGLVVSHTDFGGSWQDLTRYGTPFSLAVPRQASPTTTPAAATTSPAPRPGPTTLAGAEKLALNGALNPATARIAWGVATTAKALRAAGESVPAALRDSTPMFVIAVHGDAMTDGGPAVKAELVHRYGVMLRGDGSVDVDGDGVSLGGYFTRLEPLTLPSATVVPFASLTPAFQGFTQADSAEVADAIPVQVAVAAAKPQARDKVRVALVRTHEKHGAHQLAWVVELNAGSSNQVSLRSQHLVDAATGEQFGVAVP